MFWMFLSCSSSPPPGLECETCILITESNNPDNDGCRNQEEVLVFIVTGQNAIEICSEEEKLVIFYS